MTSLGIPAVPPPTSAPAWRTAWDLALYGPDGFYRREPPARHFRTSAHEGDALARGLLRLARQTRLDTVVDVGAGGGELLGALHRLAPELTLVGVDVADRPTGLPEQVTWSRTPPPSVAGLVVAHELLDNVPCHVVEADATGAPRVLHVDPRTGEETPGSRVDGPGVPRGMADWLARWWPSVVGAPGARAEIGTSRDRAWAAVVGSLVRGVAVAVDYGHVRERRPRLGSLRSYRDGRQVPAVPDGTRDVTAGVAVDAVAAAVGGTVLSQREALGRLGVDGRRPSLELASTAPGEYARLLARSTLEEDVRARGGLGDYYWVVSTVGDVPDVLGS